MNSLRALISGAVGAWASQEARSCWWHLESGAAWLMNLNLFGIWSIPVRNSDIGATLTGIILAGVACFWREILGMFGGPVPQVHR
jgi:hypothetical protein